jgi:hypothetical protein
MKLTKLFFIISLFSLAFVGCEIDDEPNPNGSSIGGFNQNASKSELQTLVTGIEDLVRQDFGFYYDATAIMGREYYFFTGSDPRYTGELLGKGDSQLDNAGFYGTRPYQGRFRTIKNANVLLDAVKNSQQVTAEEANGYQGFAKTMQAHEYLLALNLQYENGIRIDVADPDKLGPFVEYNAALEAIQNLLEEAAGHLESAGAAFPFKLSAAMAGFDTPDSFLKFNHALAARVALYHGNKSEAILHLATSFMEFSGDLNAGPARYYSTAGGDFANNLFRPQDQADAIIVHPSYITDLTPGDARAAKMVERPSGSLSLDGLTGTHDAWVFTSLDAPIPYIRNEELILIYAEANVGTDNNAAVDAINTIRNAHGISDYTGGTSESELMDEIMYQRRYSLFGEGHRWVDMRRWNRLGELPIDRTDDDVWVQMPRPVGEGN